MAGELRVAMVAPPWYELPPTGYGGIESVCADLTDGLLAHGVDVTLIGVGTNGTGARFVRTFAQPQHHRLGDTMPDALHAAALPSILATLDVDLVHDHSFLGPLIAARRPIPTLVTAHGPVDGEMGRYYYALGSALDLVAISRSQRSSAPWLNWAGVVHNAVRVRDFPFRADKSDFALFLGRMSPDKGLVTAIAAATCAGMDLVVAAKASEAAERQYFEVERELPALSDRLGRAVRNGDDRGAGLWHSGRGAAPRVGARGRPARRHRMGLRRRGAVAGGAAAGRRAGSGRLPGGRAGPLRRRPDGPRVPAGLPPAGGAASRSPSGRLGMSRPGRRCSGTVGAGR
jgi:hypothetical protein